jgi:DNA-binding response OmpR family regulator
MNEQKVFIIEDDDFLRSLVVTKLQKENFTVGTSADGADIISKLDDAQPQLLILDLMLPQVSGFDILKEIREHDTWKNLHVIIFSNLGDEEDIQKGTELGADDYLVKANFTLDELVDKIKGILA